MLEEKLRNHPSPSIDPSVVSELGLIGGYRDCGCPKLRFVWGQERKLWWGGQWRLLYRDPNVPANVEVWWEKKGKVFESEDDAFNDSGDGIPEIKHRLEFIGQPFWFLEHWRPAHLVDTPEHWQQMRYGQWTCPDTGLYFPRMDLLGPYPSNGQYRTRLKLITKEGEYRQPGHDIIEAIRIAIWDRDSDTRSLAQRVKDAEDEIEQREKSRLAAQKDEFVQELLPHAHRFLDNPRIYLSGMNPGTETA